MGRLAARGRREHLILRVEGIEGHHGRFCKVLKEFKVDGRRVQWLVNEDELVEDGMFTSCVPEGQCLRWIG